MKNKSAFEKTTNWISFLSGGLAIIVVYEKLDQCGDGVFKLIYIGIGFLMLVAVAIGFVRMIIEDLIGSEGMKVAIGCHPKKGISLDISFRQKPAKKSSDKRKKKEKDSCVPEEGAKVENIREKETEVEVHVQKGKDNETNE